MFRHGHGAILAASRRPFTRPARTSNFASPRRRGRVDGGEAAWQEAPMSIVGSLKDVVVSRAVRLMSDPRLTKIASDPRVMNAAMKALSLGNTVRAELTKATRLAAGVLGIATEEEMANLRSSVQTLEDSVAVLEASRPSAPVREAPTSRTG